MISPSLLKRDRHPNLPADRFHESSALLLRKLQRATAHELVLAVADPYDQDDQLTPLLETARIERCRQETRRCSPTPRFVPNPQLLAKEVKQRPTYWKMHLPSLTLEGSK